jgi:hypothetical protein
MIHKSGQVPQIKATYVDHAYAAGFLEADQISEGMRELFPVSWSALMGEG